MKNYDFYSDFGVNGKAEVALIDTERHIRAISGMWDERSGSLNITGEVLIHAATQRDVERHLLEALGRRMIAAGTVPDMVNSPPHYQILPGVEVYDVRTALLQNMVDVPAGQVDDWSRAWEYLTRMWQKNRLEDAKKCRWYLDKLIEKME